MHMCYYHQQTKVCDDVMEVVNLYTLTSEPPLVPALHGTSFETQVSLTDAPPDYYKANQVLKVRQTCLQQKKGFSKIDTRIC